MKPVRGDLPSGTVTFLFTDVEGSTKLLHELGAEGYAEALAEHRRILRQAFAAHGGVEVDTQGDAFFYAFETAPGALQAAQEALTGLSPGPIRVRIGIHTGTPHLTEEGYVGADVHRAARIMGAGHGGQVLLSAATAQLLEGSNNLLLVHLGEHRLKDFDAPVPLYQLGDGSFPPLKTISNTNLPRPASSFVGRERELEEVVSLLHDGARLLTLTGPGGSGKTRLALEAAAELVPEYKAGVFWVGLAPLRDAALVADTIAHTLGAKDGLAEHIGERELLLLIDNLEQVVEAAPELASLVETCPNLRLLVTSRELLRVRGEVEYTVPPLAEPEAVELFCVRSQVAPDETVYELCRALDNLPLAVELAAARASVLSPGQILERLAGRLDLLKGGRDADPRQQTLRATIEWSYELLSPEEQRLFARLSVFRGGSTIKAAEAVTDADLDMLQSLVDKSLLRHTEERFWMLETVRDYAAERLEGSGEADELRRRHAEHFLALAEEADAHMPVDPRQWRGRLESEDDNLRAGLDRLEAAGETQDALRLAGALSRFWTMRGKVAEGRRRLEAALAGDESPTPARAKALNAATALAVTAGDPTTASLWAEEALRLHHALGDAWGTTYSRFLLGHAADAQCEFERAQQLFEESLRGFRELGDQHHILLATRLLAWTYDELGDRSSARALYEDNLARSRATSDERMEADSLAALAEHAVEQGEIRDGVAMLDESTRIWIELGERLQMALNVCRFARAYALEGRAETAIQLLSALESLRAEIGGRAPAWVETMNEETLTTCREQLGEEAYARNWDKGRALTADDAVALALDETH
jgi:predicted ATPase/class 3 adenylate cyclase